MKVAQHLYSTNQEDKLWFKKGFGPSKGGVSELSADRKN